MPAPDSPTLRRAVFVSFSDLQEGMSDEESDEVCEILRSAINSGEGKSVIEHALASPAVVLAAFAHEGETPAIVTLRRRLSAWMGTNTLIDLES